MAHICMNQLKINGDKEAIDTFHRLVVNAASNFSGVTNGAHDVSVDENDTSETYLAYVYESKWSAIENLMEQLSSYFPTLIFRLDYHEHGSEMYGVETWQNGKIMERKSIEDFTDEKELRAWLQKEGFFELEYRCEHCACLIHQQEIIDEDDCPYCHNEISAILNS